MTRYWQICQNSPLPTEFKVQGMRYHKISHAGLPFRILTPGDSGDETPVAAGPGWAKKLLATQMQKDSDRLSTRTDAFEGLNRAS